MAYNFPMFPETTDDELMALVKAGDEGAFEALFDRHCPTVFGYCMRTFAGNRALADDVVQETWMKVTLHSRRYDPRGQFRAWLMRIARNECLVQLRRRLPLSSDEEGIVEEGVSEADIERDLLQQQENRKVHNAIQSLPDSQRVVLMLSVIDGLSHNEIAEQLGSTFGAVSALIFRARNELRRKLRREEL